MKKSILSFICFCTLSLFADVYLIDGKIQVGELHDEGGMKSFCTSEMCMILPDDAVKLDMSDEEALAKIAAEEKVDTGADESLDEFLAGFEDTMMLDYPPDEVESTEPNDGEKKEVRRLGQGYMNGEKFLEFLAQGGEKKVLDVAEGIQNAEDANELDGKGMWIVLLIALFGGLAMNLTPCVLPMIPINLMIIGKSAARGAWYGLGITLAYGAMGLLAALGGMAFGEIQSNPYFNITIAVLFVILGLSLSGVFMIDLSKKRSGLTEKRRTMLPWLFAFFMGLVSAVLAGACVAPILISVLLLTAKLYAAGNTLALFLPFILGLGMALPWPLLGAGMQVLPKPGNWMKLVNKLFAAFVFAMAVYYAYLAIETWTREKPSRSVSEELEVQLKDAKYPVLVDCWASWCKNCTAMEMETFKDEKVVEALKDYTVIRLQAEDIRELKAISGFEQVRGLPAFLIIEKK